MTSGTFSRLVRVLPGQRRTYVYGYSHLTVTTQQCISKQLRQQKYYQQQQQQQHNYIHQRFYHSNLNSMIPAISSTHYDDIGVQERYINHRRINHKLPTTNRVIMNNYIHTKVHPVNNTELPWWMIRTPSKGKGFDNFLPPESSKEDKDGDKEDNDKDKPNKEKKQEKKKKQQKRNNNDKQNNFGGDDQERKLATAVLFFLGLLYIAAKERNSDQNRNGSGQGSGGAPLTAGGPTTRGRDISWYDLLRLVQQRDILKIVIEDEGSKMARVYLKRNAIGLNSQYNYNSNHDSDQTLSMNNNSSNMNGMENEIHYNSMDPFPSSNTSENSNVSLANQSSYTIYRFSMGSSFEDFEQRLEEAQRAIYGPSTVNDIPIQYVSKSELVGVASSLLSSALIIATMFAGMSLMTAAMKGAGGGGSGGMGGMFSVGKSTHKRINKEDIKINFSDVAGCDEAKKEIMEFVDFLKDSAQFTKLGAKIPKGALLCGPPGTGKTLLAKAVAGEAGVPFFSISGSDFIEMFVGVGPSRVRDLFSEARQNAPCIVFIDEIDAVGKQRGRGGMGGNDERENTLNQLLVEMDGFSPSTGVVVLAGTNRVDILDSALTRAGRFDRQIVVDKPDLKGRQAIFKVHLKGITLEDDVEDISGRLAGLTPGFAGADIANICNEAAIVAARRNGDTVTLEDFEKATDRVIGGLESNKIMSKEERNIVAHHEAGHAVAGWFLEHADPLLKVTIIPRSSGALGFAQYLPKEIFLRTQDQIMDIVCMALAGRAAEEIFFGRVTTGASDDLKRVTRMIYSTIQLYGMNARLGQLSFPKDPNSMNDERQYSEKTAKAMDEEAKIIVDAAYQRTLNLLREKKKELEIVANMLLEKETITHDDVIDAIGHRPFKADPMYAEFIKRREDDKKNKKTEDPIIEAKENDDDDNDDDKKGTGIDTDSSNPPSQPLVNPTLYYKG